MRINDSREKAADYAAKRLQAQRNIDSRVDEILYDVACKIYAICEKYDSAFVKNKQMKAEIDAVVEGAKALIWEYENEYAKAAETVLEDDNGITAAYLAAAHNGKTFKQRQNVYVKRFVKDMMKIYYAGVVLGTTSGVIRNAMEKQYRSPYMKNGLVQSAISARSGVHVYNLPYKEAEKKAREVRETLETPSYGRGIQPEAYAQIQKNVKDTLALAWSEEDHDAAIRAGAKGFWVLRGSSYPCIDCQSHVGWLHKMDDDAPPYHSHCVCFCVYTLNEENPEL